MNRNNFLIHLALAIVLILVAAFAGQLNRWRKEWKPRIVPASDKKRVSTASDIALAERRPGRPEVLVKFKPGVSLNRIEQITLGFHDQTEDRIENAPGWSSIDDLESTFSRCARSLRAFSIASSLLIGIGQKRPVSNVCSGDGCYFRSPKWCWSRAAEVIAAVSARRMRPPSVTI